MLLFTASVSYWFNSVDPTAQPVAEIQRIQHIAAVETTANSKIDSIQHVLQATITRTQQIIQHVEIRMRCHSRSWQKPMYSNYDCRNMTITIKQVNVTKVFNETNQTNTTHLTCRNYACVTVQGPGVDQKIDTRDCLNANKHDILSLKHL